MIPCTNQRNLPVHSLSPLHRMRTSLFHTSVLMNVLQKITYHPWHSHFWFLWLPHTFHTHNPLTDWLVCLTSVRTRRSCHGRQKLLAHVAKTADDNTMRTLLVGHLPITYTQGILYGVTRCTRFPNFLSETLRLTCKTF